MEEPLPWRGKRSRFCKGRRTSSLYWGADEVLEELVLAVHVSGVTGVVVLLVELSIVGVAAVVVNNYNKKI